MDSLQWIQQFHLIRPYWLLAIFPLALTIWLYSHTHTHSRSWASVIDKRLLPHLLKDITHSKKPTPVIALFILGLIIIFALAGPAFEKRPQAVFKTQSALVIILDLSHSMDATDIKPSRLSRAQFKINDILSMRKEGQTALIAYAAGAYVVSPLTDDAETIASQVPALETHIMPAQGSRLDIALEKALQLFNNAGHSKGNILVITDSVSLNDKSALKKLSSENYITSILAVGTKEGAPIANQQGGFVKDRNGSIVVPKLDVNSIKNAAFLSGGKFSLLTSNDSDINHLLSIIDINREALGKEQTDVSGNKFKTDLWYEEGPWLILLIIPFAAYAFRKGLIFALLIFILPLPQPAQAFGWSDLWNNNNQRGTTAFEAGNAQQAAELFNDPQWKAAAQYKAGQYQESAELLNDIDTPEANYNRGNALAKANDLENAIKAYDRALQLNPEHEDAKHNKQLLEQAKQQQEQNSQEGDKNRDNKDKQKSDSDTDQQNSQKSQENSQENSEKNFPNNANENPEQQNQSKNSQEESDQQPEQQSAQPKENSDSEKEEQQAAETKDESEDKKSDEERKTQQQNLSKATPDLEQQQTQQWLKKIPDDPGGLLRRKFKYQYGREKNQNEQNPW